MTQIENMKKQSIKNQFEEYDFLTEGMLKSNNILGVETDQGTINVITTVEKLRDTEIKQYPKRTYNFEGHIKLNEKFKKFYTINNNEFIYVKKGKNIEPLKYIKNVTSLIIVDMDPGLSLDDDLTKIKGVGENRNTWDSITELLKANSKVDYPKYTQNNTKLPNPIKDQICENIDIRGKEVTRTNQEIKRVE